MRLERAVAWRNRARSGARVDARVARREAAIAVAGIGNPDRFFAPLRAHGFARSHACRFPTIIAYSRHDLAFAGARAVLMTEKDAVKCRAFADPRMWMPAGPRRASTPSLVELVVEKLDGSQAA